MTPRSTVGWIVAGAAAGYALVLRPRLLTWGATRAESSRVLPGDDLVRSRWQTTRAIGIAAPAEDVWPWLVQIGFGRAGWYSYDWLERAAGIGDFAEGGSARSVLPRFQQMTAGDEVPLGPGGGLTAAVVDPPRALVLRMTMNALTGAPARATDRASLDWSWAFVLVPGGTSCCRLLVRVRADYRPRALGLLIPLLLEPVHLMMERGMLRGIARRVEGPGRSAPGAPGKPPPDALASGDRRI